MPKRKICKHCGYARTEGSHPDNPRWHGAAGHGKTFHEFEPEKKQAGPTPRALADEWKHGGTD